MVTEHQQHSEPSLHLTVSESSAPEKRVTENISYKREDCSLSESRFCVFGVIGGLVSLRLKDTFMLKTMGRIGSAQGGFSGEKGM